MKDRRRRHRLFRGHHVTTSSQIARGCDNDSIDLNNVIRMFGVCFPSLVVTHSGEMTKQNAEREIREIGRGFVSGPATGKTKELGIALTRAQVPCDVLRQIVGNRFD